MTSALHVIWGVYGLWLPRSPQGSWREFVTGWELALYGQTRTEELGNQRASEKLLASRQASEGRWKAGFQPFTEAQRRTISCGIESFMRSHRSSIWACAILPRHVQLVMSVSPLERTDISVTLRAELTKRLHALVVRPAQELKETTYWSSTRWRQELNGDAEVLRAVQYVNELYGLEQIEPLPAPFVDQFYSRLSCREQADQYVIDREWRLAG